MNATLSAPVWVDRQFSSRRRCMVLGGLAVLAVTAASVGTSWQRIWLLLVLAPLLEECVFRAGVQEYLLTRFNSAFWANISTALVFALMHVAVRADARALTVVAPALLVGTVYGRWRQLRWCVGLHAVMNALWLGWSLTS